VGSIGEICSKEDKLLVSSINLFGHVCDQNLIFEQTACRDLINFRL
jgi:hypothetical protein